MSAPKAHYRTFFCDSARWNNFAFRPGDIVISTPPKCATTWTQMICALLIFQTPDLPLPLTQLSPWLDMLTQGKAAIFAQLEAQPHRRFIKTHTPLDGLPMDDRVTYICVGRDPRDVAISMFNHIMNMNHEAFLEAVQQAALSDGLEAPSLPARPPMEIEPFFWYWIDNPAPATESGSSLLSTLRHFEVALGVQNQANVVVMHYGDLKADCEGEMRRLAARLGIEVPEQRWPVLAQAASFDNMRARAAELAPNADQKIWKNTQQFFHSGTGGHWRQFFDGAAQQRYKARLSALTSPEVAAWAHHGRRGARP